MSGAEIHSHEIHELGRQALLDSHLQEALRSSTRRLYTKRLEAAREVPGWEGLRDRAHEIKREVMNHLDYYLSQFAEKVEENGGKVHWAATGDEA
jgi:L-lactate dehydrogenase complex protein LldF